MRTIAALRRPATLLLAALVVPLAACGQGDLEEAASGGSPGGGAGCAASLPAVAADEPAPVTTLPPLPGEPPRPIVRYTFAGPAPELPAEGVAHCFDPSGAEEREADLHDALDAGPDDQLTVSAEDDRAWHFYRGGPTPPYPTTVPGTPPAADVVDVASDDVSESDARKVAVAVLQAAGADLAAGRLDVRHELGRWWARFVPDVGGGALATDLEIGPEGEVLSGSGHLGTPLEAGRYPLVDAATALARLNAPLDQFAEAASRGRVDVPIAGAVVVPALRPTAAGTYLVPTVRFEGADGSPASTPVLAVSDALVRG